MKYSLSPQLVSFASKMAKVPFVKTVCKPFYYAYKDNLNNKRNKAFKENALKTLIEFDECMCVNGYQYTLIFGTLLGAVREKGFISHDLDIDVAMWVEDYSPEIQSKLEKYGFVLDHKFEIEGGLLAREETYVLNDVSIDLFCIYPPIDEYPYICSKWKPVEGCVTLDESMKKYGYVTGKRLEMPLKKSIVRVPFYNITLPIMTNSQEVLAFYFGEDYMNPNPQWTEADTFPYRKAWVDKKAVYIHKAK